MYNIVKNLFLSAFILSSLFYSSTARSQCSVTAPPTFTGSTHLEYFTGISASGSSVISNIAITATTSPSYINDFPSQGISANAGSAVTLYVTRIASTYVGVMWVWIDLNNDGTYEPSELVGSLLRLGTGGTGDGYTDSNYSFTVPTSGVILNTKLHMRVFLTETSTTPSPPCTGNYGQAYDFYFVVCGTPLPSISVTPTSGGYCTGGSAVSLTGSGADPGGTYLWSPSTGLSTSTGATVSANPTISTTYTVTGINNIGCGNTAIAAITVYTPPTASITPGGTSAICAHATLTLTASAGAGYQYQWYGTSGMISGATNRTYVAGVGSYDVEVTNTNSCSATSATKVINAFPPPNLGTITGPSFLCSAGTATLTETVAGGVWHVTNGHASISAGIISAISTGIDTVLYTKTFACGPDTVSFVDTIYSTPNAGTISGRGGVCTGSSITLRDFTGGGAWMVTNDSASIFVSGFSCSVSGLLVGTDTVLYIVSNSCGSDTAKKPMVIAPVPDIAPVSSQTVCSNSLTLPVTFTSSLSAVTFSWSNSLPSINLAATGIGTLSPFIANSTDTIPDTAVITVTPATASCTGVTTSFNIIVYPTPSVTVSGQSICNNDPSLPINFTSVLSAATFIWANDNTTIGLTSNGIGSIPSFTAVNTGTVSAVAVVSVTPSTATCTGIMQTFSITVNPAPGVAPVSSQTVCNNSAVAQIDFYSSVPATSFNWVNSNPAIGTLASGSGSIGTFTAINTSFVPVTAGFTITPTTTTCPGGSLTFSITVDPTPNMTTIPNDTFCNGVTTSGFIFTGDVAGTVFSWANADTTIGLHASGTGSISPFTAVNNNSVTVTSSITVTPTAAICPGTAQVFSIAVAPSPVIPIPADIVACNGATVTAVNFFDAVSTATVTWTNTNTTIGIPAGGTDSIAAFSATNTGIASDTAVITLIPVAGTCTVTPVSFKIVVNPTPSVTATSNQVVCNDSTVAVIFTGSVTGTTYTWTNSNTGIGLSATGSGSIASFTTTNASVIADTANIIVTPSANSCTGAQQTFLIIVKPTPIVNAVTGQSICNGVITDTVKFTGTPIGVSYSWTNSTLGIGLIGSGSGNILPFTATNITQAILTGTITVTPSANGCVGSNKELTITVYPTPRVDTVVGQIVCNGDSTLQVVFISSVTGATYIWKNNNVSIGLDTAGIDTIARFIAKDTLTIPDTAVITVTPAANGCPGIAQNFNIVTKPTPVMTSLLTESICSGGQFNYTPTSDISGTTYMWDRATVNHISPAGAIGTSSVNETLTSDTLGAVTVTYVYTLTANSCKNIQDLILSVHPAPSLPQISTHPSLSICSGTMYQNFGVSVAPLAGEQYVWTATNATIFAQGNNHQYALISFPEQGTSVISLKANIDGVVCGSNDSLTINVGSTTAETPQMVYYYDYFVCLESNVDSYQWGYDDKNTLDSAILTGEVTQSYYNASPDTNNKYYWVMTTKGGCTQKTYYSVPNSVAMVAASNENSILLFPNPAKQEISMTITGGNISEVRVYDMMGKEWATTSVTNNTASINVASLPSGIYFASCFQSGVRMASVRFVKE